MMTSAFDREDIPATLLNTWQERATRPLLLRDGHTLFLRSVMPGDADRMADFFSTLTEREVFYFFSLDTAAARGLALRAAADPAMRLIALDNQDGHERIAGYMFLDWADGSVPTFGACLSEDMQSRGLGRTMMEHLLALASTSGIQRVRLTAHAENWRALRLYQRLGFRITGEMILERQGVKQYRMEVDLQQPQRETMDDLTLVVRGGLGVGLAAVRIQGALESLLGAQPLILDRPVRAEGYTIIVADLAALPEHPFETPASPVQQDPLGLGWVRSLDARTVLVGGYGAAPVARATDCYVGLLPVASPGEQFTLAALPFAGLHAQC